MTDDPEGNSLEGNDTQEADLPSAPALPQVDEDGRGQLLLTDEERKKVLGRMVDFEARLAALPEKQANFVLAVLQDPTNYTAAARKAGYAYPNVEATRLLNNPNVAACIAAGEQLREDRTLLTSERTMHEFAIIGFSDIRNYVVDNNGNVDVRPGVPEYATRAISSVEIDRTEWVELNDEGEKVPHKRVKVKLRLWNKNDALKMIAMYQKLLSGEGGVNIGTMNVDARTTEIHKHEHNTWEIGGVKVTF